MTALAVVLACAWLQHPAAAQGPWSGVLPGEWTSGSPCPVAPPDASAPEPPRRGAPPAASPSNPLRGGLAPQVPAPAIAWEIVPDESVLAVVTRRGGFAGRLAHDHLVVATDYAATLSLDPADPLGSGFVVELPVEALVVDEPELVRRWHPRLVELGVLDGPPGSPSDGDRSRIRREMLDEGQLHAAAHPSIGARVFAVERADTTLGEVDFAYRVALELTVRGVPVRVPVAVRTVEGDGSVTVEAVGEARFTDFGIEPYSAYLGAVKNRDRFHVYLSLRATAAADPPGR